jgi:hypothetical protein
VEQKRRGDAAGKRAIDRRIVVPDLDDDFRCHGLGTLVDAAFERGVRVCVDDPRHHVLAGAVDDANA